MALTTTTLSSAVAVNDTSIVVASATGFAAGNLIRIDEEMLQVAKNYVTGTTIPVLRGQDGSATVAHKASANVTTFLASDEPGPSPQTAVQFPAQRPRRVLSYSAAGAITLPSPGEDMVAVINGTGALAMTLASPTKDMDGCMLFFAPNGKAAHTVTYTAGFGANTTNSDVLTFHATQVTCVQAMAMNGVWQLIGFVAGAATVAGAGLA
jgi:hypothetical protein